MTYTGYERNPEVRAVDVLPAFFIFSLISSILAALGLTAAAWGTDSRPSIGDDHAR